MGDRTRGLYGKFRVERLDGKSAPGEKHDGCDYFVLDLTHDPYAVLALATYAGQCEEEYPLLADDLWEKVFAMKRARRANQPRGEYAGGV